MTKPKVYIVILNWNGYKDTIACLESIKKLKYNNFAVIVCDNASTDNSLEYISAWIDKENKLKARLIVNKDNLGFAGGNNVGISEALKDLSTEYIWILNNDTEVDVLALDKLVNKMMSNTAIGICGSKLIYWYDHKTIQGYGGKYNKYLGIPNSIKASSEIAKMNYPIGASMLVSRKFLNDVGLMCEDYFLYFEELDWSLRGKEKNYKIACATDSVVYHKEGASIGSDSNISEKSLLADYYQQRNKIIFTKKFFPKCLSILRASMLLGVLRRLWHKDYKKALQQLKIILTV